MDFDRVEKLRREYTDQHVAVDPSRPELRRFQGMTGTVKTVNMNGLALVEFDGNNNRGWYDIAIEFLRVVDEPLSKEEEAKPAAEAKEQPVAAEKTANEKGGAAP